jgi:hypothetical protein
VPVCLRADLAALRHLRQQVPACVSAHTRWGCSGTHCCKRTAAAACCLQACACNSIVDDGRVAGRPLSGGRRWARRARQGRQELREGIGRGTEEEEDLDPVAARRFIAEPAALLQLDSPLVQKVRRCVRRRGERRAANGGTFGRCSCSRAGSGARAASGAGSVAAHRGLRLLQLQPASLRAPSGRRRRDTGVAELVCLGGFRNVRSDFDWEGFKLELDETRFEWGTVYEIEVETVRD